MTLSPVNIFLRNEKFSTFRPRKNSCGKINIYTWFKLSCNQPPSKVFRSSFLDDKTSTPDVFSSYLFIPQTHFETSLVLVSFYGYDIWRHKWLVVKAILEWKCMIFNFFLFFQNQSLWLKWRKVLIRVLFCMSSSNNYQFLQSIPDF